MEEVIGNNDSFVVDTSSTTAKNNTDTNKVKTPRKSGIELLKIIGMLLIVIYHVYCTVSGVHVSVEGLTDYVIKIESTTNFSNIILRILSTFGPLGNAIFFACSAWFLLDKETSNKKKIIKNCC